MSEREQSERKRDRLRSWLTDPARRGTVIGAIAAIVIIVLLGAQSIRADQTESAARRAAATIAYKNAINSCEREIPVREATRANAQAIQLAFSVLDGFFKVARPRAFAQSQDMKISQLSRVGAQKSLKSIDHAIATFAVKLSIPPPPLPCDQVITDPNRSAAPHHN